MSNKKKTKNSVAVTISMEPELFEEFEKYVEDQFIDKSRLVSSLVMDYIKAKRAEKI